MSRLPHPFRAASPAPAPGRLDLATWSLGSTTADGTAEAPAYVWPLNPWGGYPFRHASD